MGLTGRNRKHIHGVFEKAGAKYYGNMAPEKLLVSIGNRRPVERRCIRVGACAGGRVLQETWEEGSQPGSGESGSEGRSREEQLKPGTSECAGTRRVFHRQK